MDKQVEDKIRERYARCDSKHFDKFILENPDVKRELEIILASEPWFENLKNVYTGFNHGVYGPVKCLHCGKFLNVKNAVYRKHKYCCKKCADSDTRTSELRERTCIERYGSRTPLLNEDCKRKSIETCRKKFGNDSFAGSEEYKKRVQSPFRLKEVHDKAVHTMIERYGQDYGAKRFDKYKHKMMNTNMEKYGVPFVLMNDEKRKSGLDTIEAKYGDRLYHQKKSVQSHFDIGYDNILSWNEYVVPLFSRDDYEGHGEKSYRWKCVKCGSEFESRIYITGLGPSRMVPRCEKCFPMQGCSIVEKELVEYVKSIYNGEMRLKDQTIINRKELDIYIPGKNLAMEFDGLYWHSEACGKDKNYHLNKTIACEKRGIKLIHIFEDEWLNKQEIVKDRIKSAFGIYDKRIFARKCIVKEVDSKISNDFLESSHLQGGDNSSIRYGLFFENELVSVMTFGKPRFNKNYDWELIRFASKLGLQVIGGASKLLKHFRSEHDGSLISYADRRYSNGRLYKSVGFKKIGESRPNYWYVKKDIRLNRYQCQKHRLVNLLGDKFDPAKSESENMLLNGYSRIYDCGNLIFCID